MPKRRFLARLEEFLALEEAHPYGVLPGGNRFFGSSGQDSSTKKKEGVSAETVFPDGLWQQILSFCDAPTLGNLVQTSKYLYVAGHQPELWRDLVLRTCQTSKTDIDRRAHGSWKDTYIALFIMTPSAKTNIWVHQPIPVSGIYSDEYYRSHLCRSFAIPKCWLQSSAAPDKTDNETTVRWATTSSDPREPRRVSYQSWTTEQHMTWEESNQPLIVEGAAAQTQAVKKWATTGPDTPDYMRSCSAPNKTFRATSGAAPLPANFTLEGYQNYGNRFSYLEESPMYLFDRSAFDDNDQWRSDFFPEFYRNCPYWDPSSQQNGGHDLLQVLGEGKRPDHTWLIMGPKRSGSVFHIDPNCTHAWNVCIAGRKRWIFYPPGVNPPGVYPSSDGDEVALPLSVGEWILQYWKEHTQRYHHTTPIEERPVECTVGPGDVIFVPHGWWHMVINLDDVNMAITHNYVSPSNLGNVLKFFNTKQDQISGCRDRPDSIKPEHLHDEFVKALASQDSPDYKRYLANAQAQKVWTCSAWKDENGPSQGNDSLGGQKRPRPDGEADEEEPDAKKNSTAPPTAGSSIMAKTEKVATFTFSFL